MTPLKRTAIGILAVLLSPAINTAEAQTSGQSEFEQSTAILDTSVLFAIGAQEADQALRGSFGWPTFQEGFVEGVYFRFDPDGYARFSPSPRLDEDVFEAICVEASTACIAKKGILEIGLTPAGQVQLRLNGITPTDNFFVSDRKSELPLPPSILEPLAPRLESLLSGGGELVIKREIEVVQSVSLSGFAAVATYLRWVAQNQSPRIFPRGWPVPSQSQNQISSGLTQPNQWSSPNPGPQIAETTWHIQQSRQKRRTSIGSGSPYSFWNSQAANSLRPNPVPAPFQSSLPAANPVADLQLQILRLQNNLQQVQARTRTGTSNHTQPSPLSVNRYPSEDLKEFGQSFAQQAQGRSLPASPGGLGVGGDSSSAASDYRSVDLHPKQLTMLGNRPASQQQEWSMPNGPDQFFLSNRIAALEKIVLDLRRDMSLQILELRQDFSKKSKAQIFGSLDNSQQPTFGKAAPSIEFSQETSSLGTTSILEKLEKNLLGRLSARNQGTIPPNIITSAEPDSVSVNRQLIEEILSELGDDTDLPGQADAGLPKNNPPDDDFVTLNDYINQVLQSEGQKPRAPGR